jgi:hypothetical protein
MNYLKVVLGALWGFLAPFVKAFATEAGRFAKDRAEIYVPMIADSLRGEPGSVKRDEVFRLIKEDAINAGITITSTLILNAIQAIYSDKYGV